MRARTARLSCGIRTRTHAPSRVLEACHCPLLVFRELVLQIVSGTGKVSERSWPIGGRSPAALRSGPGLAVHRDAGAAGLAGVLLAAGALAGLNSWGRARQAEAQLTGEIPRAPDSLPEAARGAWDSLRRGAAKCVAPTVVAKTESFGASGAVSGLVGYGVALAAWQLWSWARRARLRSQEELQDLTLQGALESGWQARATLGNALSVVQCGHFVFSEWRAASGDEGLTGVDHAGHLTGFVVGVAVAAATGLVRSLRQAPPPARPLGRSRRRHVDASGNIVG